MSLSPAAILSDLDGVLVDSGQAIERTWSTWARRHGIDPALLEGRIHGRPAGDVIREVAPGLDADADADAESVIVSQMDIDGPAARVLPGAAALLSGAAGVPVAIVTSCPDALARTRLATGDLQVPDVLITADRVRAGKPDPEGYRLAAAQLRVAPTACLVLEDAPAGIAAGAAAGATVIGITTTHPAEELLATGAAHAAGSVADALDLLARRAGRGGRGGPRAPARGGTTTGTACARPSPW